MRTALVAAGALLAFSSVPAKGDHGGDPMPIVERFTFFPGEFSVGQVFQESYPTEVVANRRKSIILAGAFFNLDATNQPANFTYWIEWFDPRLPGGSDMTAAQMVTVLPQTRAPFVMQMIVPFTPQRVGLYLSNDGPGDPVTVSAALTHLTVEIPEPESWRMAAVIAATAAVERRMNLFRTFRRSKRI